MNSDRNHRQPLPLPPPLPLGEAGVRVRRMGEDRGEGAQRVAEILEA